MTVEMIVEQASEYLPPDDVELIERAYQVTHRAKKEWAQESGDEAVFVSLDTARKLVELRLDAETIVAPLLYDAIETGQVHLEELREAFGEQVASLVEGLTKFSGVDENIGDQVEQRSDRESEVWRRMLLATVDDPRVIMIKLADQVETLRELKVAGDSENCQHAARETLDIFAPLAGRLGMYQVKWELEDLAFQCVNPQAYADIADKLNERRQERERQVNAFIERIREALVDEGITGAVVVGRPKHIYSIHKKMQRKGVSFDEIYDVRAVRIIVNTIPECYHALGIVHSLWRPSQGGFDDYIASPKDNSYQSLHTDVIAEDGRTLEVQIRTEEMHELAEFGIAAHWKYKEHRQQTDTVLENKIKWLQSVLAAPRDEETQSFVELIKSDIFRDQVYVFTPRGKAIELPVGSTPVDFAYHVHTEIGHRCRGAKVNGRLVALNYQLENGDQVEILTTKRGGPSRDWLNPDLGYTRTGRARQKVRQWFRRQAREQNIERGREIVERELRRLSVEKLEVEDVALLFRKDNPDEFLARVGTGDVSPSAIATKLAETAPEEEDLGLPPPQPAALPTLDTSIRVKGVGNLMTNLARCCNPVPGDPIIGYITRGRGVTIHRKDCPNILSTDERDRLIEVGWGEEKKTYPVRVRIKAYDRTRLLRDIGEVIGNEEVGMSRADVTTHKEQNLATFTVVLEVTDMSQLSRVLSRLELLPNVLEARRIKG